MDKCRVYREPTEFVQVGFVYLINDIKSFEINIK